MKSGDTVIILGRRRTLVRELASIPGAWEINKPVEGFVHWHKSEIWKPCSKTSDAKKDTK